MELDSQSEGAVVVIKGMVGGFIVNESSGANFISGHYN